MRPFLRRCLTAIFLFFASLISFAQPAADYNIDLHSGKFVPEANIKGITKNAPVFTQSKFQNNYYVVIQFQTLPTNNDKAQLKTAGIALGDYLPSNAFLATLSQDFSLSILSSKNARAIFQLKGAHKTVPAFMQGKFPVHAIRPNGMVDLTITTYETFAAEAVAPALQAAGAQIIDAAPLFKNFTVRIPQNRFTDLLDLPFILWVEAVDAPNQVENLLGRTLHRVNVLNDGVRNLKGNGINVGIWDESEVDDHLDFTPTATRLLIQEAGTPSSHSTHCGGTIAGNGLINPKARGMAPKSKLYSWNFNGNIQTEMATAIPALGLSVSSHSYGSTQTCGVTGAGVAYSATSRNTDINLNNFPNHLHVHSAGNSQTACTGGWSTITGSGKTSKNNILVANITTTEAMAGTSSFGPVADGRVKPEISSFGTNVLSTYPNNQYGTISGTSMATPGVSGTVALLVERYRQLNGNADPISALIKNTILNTAQDLGNIGPDYKFGFGRLNALAAVKILEQNRYAISTISTGGSNDISVNVPAGAARLRVMLTWNDPAGLANANPALVNNLDLTVINGATTSLPWILDPLNPAAAATKATDNVSNIEQVTIENPAAGSYTLRVAGTTVPVGPQQYSITWSIEQPFIEVIFPNGNESLSPGSAETITWDNAGINTPQTVEYSINNGATWTTISSTVPANTTRLSWTVPAANTSTALVRVSNGAITDNSDATFKILGTPGSLNAAPASCGAGELAFSWGAVANATHYDILRLDETTGEFVVAAANIAATTYTLTGLTASSVHWFSLVAKNNTTGAVSDRALAESFTVPATGLGNLGTISGNAIVCGAASNVNYSVSAISGATTYNWTVPAGASIVSGQGTPTLMVNFPGTAISGNITAQASSGSCQSNIASLAVSASSASITAPVTGGNQTITHCSPNPMPTLTATATVAAGQTLVWFDMPTNGSVVVNPVLNSYGSVTYYAGSVDNATNCQSSTRTAVVLTITQAPQPVITAGGPIVFCQGSSVQLTATAGSSYSWSNGASTQAITVTNGGTYSVTINQGNGCIGTSNAITVVVNPLPVISVAASGPTTFCQGGSVQLTATAGNSYAWSNGATTQSINVTTGGTYSVTVNNGNGCANSSAATTVTVNPLPTVSLSAAPYTRLFPGLQTTLTAGATNAASYAWFKNGVLQTSATGSSLVVDIDDLGDYSVTVSAVGGCSKSSAIVSISDSAVARLFIYPNPNNGQFQVSYHNEPLAKQVLTIFDSKGAKVFSKTYDLATTYQRMPVDLRRNRAGVYSIVLTDKNGKKIATGSVLIQ
ncbi:MAG: T9SS type A sorting domain-containing protein [Sphingobacteriales bacterium]|nr:MAG: T9SS type A sorting domain-containing protein [Sphingobacteriales bacterium]